MERIAKNGPSSDHVTVEEEYIEMDVSSTTFLFCGKSSREFEFQMSANPPEREAATAPADELFYKGKLLPLLLPPRLQMVQNLLAVAATATASESCNISPSGELKREEHMNQRRKHWPKKLKLIRHSYLALKLKASKAYLKSLFAARPGCYDESDSAPTAATLRDKLLEEECTHRKSFSGAINCQLMSRPSAAAEVSPCSSSSSSFSSVNSCRFNGPQMLNRSSSVNSEMEGSIQGAIAYCKKSHVCSRKSVSDVEHC